MLSNAFSAYRLDSSIRPVTAPPVLGSPYGSVATTAGLLSLTSTPSTFEALLALPLDLGPSSDFDGNNHPDILWQEPSTGMGEQWSMNGLNLSSVTRFSGSTHWAIVGTGESRHSVARGVVEIWLMNGFNVTAVASIGSGVDWNIAGAGDFDGDGNADVLWRQTSTGTVETWFMNGPTRIDRSCRDLAHERSGCQELGWCRCQRGLVCRGAKMNATIVGDRASQAHTPRLLADAIARALFS